MIFVGMKADYDKISKTARVMQENWGLVLGCEHCGSRNIDFCGNTENELVIECNVCGELS